jgi:predicted nucleotidyltransferase
VSSTVRSRFDDASEAIRALFEGEGVLLGYIFGSAASGTERGDSDLDVGVLLRDEVHRARRNDALLHLNTELVGLTHTNDVDVVILNDAAPLLAFNIISEGRLFFGSNEDRVPFEVAVIQRYIDTIPIRKKMEGALKRRIRGMTAQEGTGSW